jgi:cytochrome c peroxidase
MRRITIFVPIFLLIIYSPVFSLDLDQKLSLVIKVYDLRPKQCESSKSSTSSPEQLVAGEMLFKSTSLSGDRDISCSSCHLERFGIADGLPIAVGVGGRGEGYDRLSSEKGTLVQRNALSLLGRGDDSFTTFFWDGRVQVAEGRIISQFGDAIQGKFSSPLAVAAILPLIERDEFIGKGRILLENDIQHEVENKLYYERYLAVSKALRDRFLNPQNTDDKNVAEGLKKTGVSLDDLELADLGNLLAIFIKGKFKCETSAWDRYLSGDKNSLSEQQKYGAILFYGKGRCASCHSGNYFSDYDFHSIGTPQGSFGPHSRHRDIGRAGVTHRAKDLYKFRTPPLNSVIKTSPYGHNGAFPSLEEVVVHHFNPLAFYIDRSDYYSSDYFAIGKIMDSRDQILASIEIHSTDEVAAILEFLKAL